VVVYPHADVARLERLIERNRTRGRAALVVTESLFSMDGDIAPLADLRALCDRFDCGLVVDEAHAIGVLGPGGRGVCARENIQADLTIGTLGKAFGTAGAFVVGAAPVIALLENRARSYVFSTAPSPSLAAAAVAATDLVEAADDRRATLLASAATLRAGLTSLGYELGVGQDHIIPVLVGEPAATMQLSARLLDLGVFVHGIRPPTVPPGTSRLRVAPMATHEPQHLVATLRAFEQARAASRPT
jgi:7-keto-8-aminopelargonate synthetase-like enzyme